MIIVNNVHKPSVRFAFRLLLGGCTAQLIISWTITGGQWVYTPHNVMSAIPLVGGTFGYLIKELINTEVEAKAEAQVKTIVIETMAQLKKENDEKNGNPATQSDGTNG
jgi:hypothetical protein